MEKSYVKDFKDCLIPMGMIFGCAIGIGYLIGVTAYSVYSKKKIVYKGCG